MTHMRLTPKASQRGESSAVAFGQTNVLATMNAPARPIPVWPSQLGNDLRRRHRRRLHVRLLRGAVMFVRWTSRSPRVVGLQLLERAVALGAHPSGKHSTSRSHGWKRLERRQARRQLGRDERMHGRHRR